MPGLIVPPLCKWEANARNGQSPSSSFYAQAIHAQNFNMVHRTREIYSKTWPLGTWYGASGTTTVSRFRFRSRYGATRLRAHVIMGLERAFGGTGGGLAADPRISITVDDGSTTETIGPFYFGSDVNGGTDAPDEWVVTNSYCEIDPATTYTCSIDAIDYARPLAIMIHEEIDATIDPAVNYFNGTSPGVGVPLFDSLRERLLLGSVNMWKQGAGTLVHWSNDLGTAQTRSSATYANLIDGSTTGSPATSAPGFYLDLNYRNRLSRTTVDFEFAVYAWTSSGTGGAVVLTDSGGTDRISISGIGTTPQWHVATGALPTAETWYAPRFACDGANTLNVTAMSLAEWVA